MNDLLPPRPASAPTPPGPDATRAGDAPVQLVIGALGIPDKEQLVLRSLIRLLDGRDGLRLRHAEAVADCSVVFVGGDAPPRLPGRCVAVHLADDHAAPAHGLTVAPPLRMTNVLAVLHLAGQLLAATPVAAAHGDDGLPVLFRQLSHHLLARERRVTVLPLHDARLLTVDFAAERLHTPLPVDALLAGRYGIGAPRRASPEERELLERAGTTGLRDLLWRAALRLGDDGAAAPLLRGSLRLRRWPDAVVLSRPGMPRLCALLTSRALDVEQAAADSGLAPSAVAWLLHAALALGVAVPVDDGTATAPAPVLPAVPAAAEPRSLLGRLRDRLKLW